MRTPTLDRRMVIAGALAGVAGSALAQAPETPAAILGERFPIWPGAVPGAAGVSVAEGFERGMLRHTVRPTLSIWRPARANGAAVLLIPGGGYRGVSIENEGRLVALRLAAAGYHAFVLAYRMPGDGWAAGPDAPFQDAQRAMRVIGARAKADGFDATRIAAIGFSAGGHLAGWLSTQGTRASYPPIDAADGLSARPRVTGLLYPVINISGERAHQGSRQSLVGASASEQRAAQFDVDAMVNPQTPPTFLAHAIDDATVPVDNSIVMLAALRAAEVPAEMHLFERGGHGFGLRGPDRTPGATPSPWPDLFLAWAAPHLA